MNVVNNNGYKHVITQGAIISNRAVSLTTKGLRRRSVCCIILVL